MCWWTTQGRMGAPVTVSIHTVDQSVRGATLCAHLVHWYVRVSYIDGLVQERRNSITNALELRLFAPTHRYAHWKELWISELRYPTLWIQMLNKYTTSREFRHE